MCCGSSAAPMAAATWLGFSETVFVDDPAVGTVDIYTPSVRLPFAGHPLVGAAWLLRTGGAAPTVLRPPAGEVPCRFDGAGDWITGRAEWAVGRTTRQYPSVAEVDALPAPPPGTGWLYAWAWADEAAGRVRARAFPRRGDAIVEDEATGAAALVLTAELGRALVIRQGVGSQLLTRPQPDGGIEVGGLVAPVEVRRL
jgi:predicted PhzF superfamily epimerase YddE/YHI9